MRSKADPLVSILTPAYNAAPHLSETICSALSQTLRDFELLVVDDGSTDGTLELARQWERRDTRIRVYSRPNGGSAAARNVALRHARGSFLALLDSDDIWRPQFLAKQMEVFRRFPEADVVTGNVYNLGGLFDGLVLRTRDSSFRRVSLLEILEHENLLCILSIFRRRVAERIGAFDEGLCHNEDYHYWIRAALAGFVIVSNPEPLVYYRRRPDSKSTDEVGMLHGIVRVLKGIRPMCLDKPAELAAIDRQIRRFENEELFASGKAHLVRREFAAAARDFAALSDAKRDLRSRFIARMSCRLPRMLLWGYQTKCALRSGSAASRAYQKRRKRCV